MFEKSHLSQLIEPLRSQFMVMKECLACKRKITNKDIKVVNEESSSAVLHLSCPYCQNSLVLVVAISDIGVELVGMISDLTYDDTKKFSTKEAINEDFLLDAYQTLYKISFNL